MRKPASVLALLLALLLFLTGSPGCWHSEPGSDNPPASEPEARSEEILLAAVGDIMMHNNQINAGAQTGGEYSYDHFFAAIQEYLAAADLTVGNLETTLAGKEKKYTGYPMFNSPDAIASVLQRAGFDLLTTANNHSLDRAEAGVRRTVEVLDSIGLAHTGTFLSAEERDQPLLLEVRGVRLAFLAYTYGTNGLPLPKGKSYLVNLLDRDIILADVARAKSLGADLIVASLHFGAEYNSTPNREQEEWAEQLIRGGVDLILGGHPHVLQPYEKITLTEDDGSQREGWVIYSMGNFISGQVGLQRETGAIFYCRIEKDLVTNQTWVKEITYLPTWTYRYPEQGKTQFRVLPVERALEDYASGEDHLLTPTAHSTLERAWDHAQSVLGKELQSTHWLDTGE